MVGHVCFEPLVVVLLVVITIVFRAAMNREEGIGIVEDDS